MLRLIFLVSLFALSLSSASVGSLSVEEDGSGLAKDLYEMADVVRVDLDEAKGIKEFQCNAANNETIITFDSEDNAKDFYTKIEPSGSKIYITSVKHNCSAFPITLQRVLASAVHTTVVTMQTLEATYVEVFKSLVVSIRPDETCFGVNSNTACTHAKSAFPVFVDNLVDAACSNCFAGVKAKVAFNLTIKESSISELSIELRDIAGSGALMMDMYVHGECSRPVGLNSESGQRVMLKKVIAGVPFAVWYEIPAELMLNVLTSARARILSGITTQWKVDEAVFRWTADKGWTFTRTNPVFNWTPSLDARGTFRASASLSTNHSVKVHAAKVADMELKLELKTRLSDASGDRDEEKAQGDVGCEAVAVGLGKLVGREELGVNEILRVNESRKLETGMY